jgi:hypothetical protein
MIPFAVYVVITPVNRDRRSLPSPIHTIQIFTHEPFYGGECRCMIQSLLSRQRRFYRGFFP